MYNITSCISSKSQLCLLCIPFPRRIEHLFGMYFEHVGINALSMEMHEELIRNKIAEIGSAIFYNVSQSPQMISTHLISSVSYDEEGRLYFFAPRPLYLQREDIRFPAELDFYKKGNPIFIKINGIAELLTDIQEISRVHTRTSHTLHEPAGITPYALVRMDVKKVEYTDHTPKSKGLIDRLRAVFLSWF